MLSKQLTDSIAMYSKHNHYRYLPIMSRSVEKTCKYSAALFTAVTDDVKASQSHNDIGDIGIALIVGAEGPGGSLGMGRTWPHTLHEDVRQTMTNEETHVENMVEHHLGTRQSTDAKLQGLPMGVNYANPDSVSHVS